jgi:hypothetical protein
MLPSPQPTPSHTRSLVPVFVQRLAKINVVPVRKNGEAQITNNLPKLRVERNIFRPKRSRRSGQRKFGCDDRSNAGQRLSAVRCPIPDAQSPNPSARNFAANSLDHRFQRHLGTVIQIHQIEVLRPQQFQIGTDILADRLGRETINRAAGQVVPSIVANLRTQKKLRTQAITLKPLAGREPAVNLATFPVQMNAVAAKPDIFVKRKLVRICIRGRGMRHDVAQPAADGRYLDLSKCHFQLCRQPPCLLQ